MFSEKEKEVFIEHSLINENNLRISINAALCFDDLRKKIIQQFANELEEEIKRKFGQEWANGWKIENSLKQEVFERYSGIFLYKDYWKGKYKIGISAEKYSAKGFIVGIAKYNEDLPNFELLFEKLNNEYRQGLKSDWWVWYQWLEHPYDNWDKEEPLIRMYNSTAGNDIATMLYRIAMCSYEQIDAKCNS